ncbi:MAG: hypothetical protein HRT86_09150 [Ilumatobacteraceae bacterium]|nr:hypothetical protein [Ilumatobacteraceae bacterium]
MDTPPFDPDSVLDAAARDVVVVEGPDARSYLHSQLSQDVESVAVGDVSWSLVLAPTGKVEGLMRLTRTADDRFELTTDAGYGEPLVARLERFKIRVDAALSLQAAASAAPDDAAESRRVAAGWPRLGAEIVPGETIPAVTGILPLVVSFTKGCYPGQELVERMDSRGADAPRTLRVFDDLGNVAPGDDILDGDGQVVGAVTSVAGGHALGYVKRGAEVGRVPAVVAQPNS